MMHKVYTLALTGMLATGAMAVVTDADEAVNNEMVDAGQDDDKGGEEQQDESSDTTDDKGGEEQQDESSDTTDDKGGEEQQDDSSDTTDDKGGEEQQDDSSDTTDGKGDDEQQDEEQQDDTSDTSDTSSSDEGKGKTLSASDYKRAFGAKTGSTKRRKGWHVRKRPMVEVTSPVKGGFLEKLKLEEGDVIARVGEYKIESDADLYEASQNATGETVVTVQKGGKGKFQRPTVEL